MASKQVLRVCVTGAAGQIAYSLLPHICLGRTFGPNTGIILHLLDIERAQTVSAPRDDARARPPPSAPDARASASSDAGPVTALSLCARHGRRR